MSSPGGQSQYRAFASVGLTLNAAIEALDDLMITKTSPEEEIYKALTPIKEKMISASKEVEDRVDLIFKADQDSKFGWKAVSLLEEKERLGTKDPEKDKAFQSCLKQVQDAHKKSFSSSSASRSSRPFSRRPGGEPGFNGSSSSGDVTCNNIFTTTILGLFFCLCGLGCHTQ